MSQFPQATGPESLRQALEAGTPLTVLDIRMPADRAEW